MTLPPADEWVTTSTVLQRLADFDDRGAWQRLHERFQRPIQAFAARQGLDAAEAEDAAQDALLAFAEAYRRGEYDRGRGRLSSWLFGIAWRRIDHARRRLDGRARPPQESSAWLALEAPAQASPEWEELWERSMLEHCLRQVRKEFEPATFRVFELLVLEQHTIEQAEGELGLSRNAIAIAKHRVSKRLRELLEQCDEVAP